MKTKLPDPMEWVKVNRHLQSVGTATCDVSSLILEADILRSEESNSRAAFMLMSAARDVLRHRRTVRQAYARANNAKRMPLKKSR